MKSSTIRIRRLALTLALAVTFAFGSISLHAQAAPAPHWTTDQIVTATVHQAWILAGRDEGNFFQIIQQLAEISAKNRNLTLPDNPEAGKKAGAYIKKQAQTDHDQLLYAIVDQSVRMTGVPASTK